MKYVMVQIMYGTMYVHIHEGTRKCFAKKRKETTCSIRKNKVFRILTFTHFLYESGEHNMRWRFVKKGQ